VTPEDLDRSQVADEASAVTAYQGIEYQHQGEYDSPSAKLKLQTIGEERMLHCNKKYLGFLERTAEGRMLRCNQKYLDFLE
jgi:hypothetical protein